MNNIIVSKFAAKKLKSSITYSPKLVKNLPVQEMKET